MPIVIHAKNNTASRQRVQVRSDPQGAALASVTIPAQDNVTLYVVPADANVNLYLVCEDDVTQVAELTVFYQAFSSVVQNSYWQRQWTVGGATEKIQLQLA